MPKRRLTDAIQQFFPAIFFGACFLAALFWRALASGSAALDLFLISSAVLATLLVMNQRLPLQNVIGLVITISVFWWATLLIAKVSGIFLFPPRFGFQFFREYQLGLFWTVGLINARGVARLVLQRWRQSGNFGLWLIALSSFLIAIEDSRARHDLAQFVAKFLFAAVAFAGLTPWFLDKRRVEEKADAQPLFITVLLLLW